MSSLFTLPFNGKTVDLSVIVAIGAVFENYKYVEPYLFSIDIVTEKGHASILVGNESFSQAQDDYGNLMSAWAAFKQHSA